MKTVLIKIILIFSFLATTSCDYFSVGGLSDGSIDFDGIETVERTISGSYLLIWKPANTNQKIKYAIFAQEIGAVSIAAPEGSQEILSTNGSRTAFKASSTEEIIPYQFGQLVATVEGEKNSYELKQSFKPNTTYAFQVRVIGEDQSTDSNKTVIYLSASEDSEYNGCVSTTPVSASEIKITVDYPIGANSVRVFRDDVEVFITESESVTSFIDKGLDLEATYKYKCVATVGNDIWVGTNQIETSPKNPFLDYKGCISAVVNSVDIQLDFEFPLDADEVVIFRDNVSVFTSKSKAGTTFIDQGLTPGKTYNYTCEARKGTTALKGYNEIPVEVTDPFSNYIGCTNAVALGSSSIRVTFDFPTVAEKTSIFRNGVEVFATKSKAETTFIDTGLNEAQKYKYKCQASLGDFKKVGSDEIEITTLSTNPPIFIGITDLTIISDTELEVKWGVPSTSGVSASYFKVYATIGSETNFELDPIKTISAGEISTVINNLGDEMPYSFAVRACSIEDICDQNLNTIAVVMPDGGAPKTIGALTATVENGEIKIEAPWNHSNGAIFKRRVYRRSGEDSGFDISDYALVKTVPVPSVGDPATQIFVGNISEDTKYHFIVTDEDPAGNISVPTQVATVITGDLTAPSFSGIGGIGIGQADQESTTLKIAFTAAIVETPATPNGASHYVVYTKYGGGDACVDGKLFGEFPAVLYTAGNSSEILIDNLDEKTFYSICLKAKDSSGNLSNSTTYLSRYTLDKTSPNFDGVQFAIYNNITSKIDVSWNPSSSADSIEYKVKVWKNTNTPIPADVTTFVKASNFFSNGFSFSDAEFAFLGDDTIYFMVDACDDAATILDGSQNCSASPIPLTYTVPDVTPPQGFLGIEGSGLLSTPSEGSVEIYWKAPNPLDWSDYRGFKIFSVESAEDPIDENDLVFLKDCPCSGIDCPNAITSCTVSGLNPFRTYLFHVRAYDANGNITSYVNPAVFSTPKRTTDTTPPIFSSNLTATYETGAVVLTYAEAGDSQYALEPNSKILYNIYRRQDQTFTSAINPTLDVDSALLVATESLEFPDTQLLSNVDFYYTVCAVDASGNENCDGTVRTITTPDVEPPVIADLISNKETEKDIKEWDLTWTMTDNSDVNTLRVTIKSLISDAPDAPEDKNEYTTTVVETDGILTFTGLKGPSDVNKFIHYFISIRDLAGNSVTETYTVFSQNEVTISKVMRDHGTRDGGKLIVIEGDGFVDGLTINIGAVPCFNIKVYYSKAVGCTTPPQAEGTYPITIVNPSATGQASLATGYKYIDPAGGEAGFCDLVTSGGSSFPDGDGSIGNPYKICNGDQLDEIRNTVDRKSYELHDNIDLSSFTNNSFTPITKSNRTDEVRNIGFDGKGHYIASWTYSDPVGYRVGLFKRIDGDETLIDNLNIVDFDVTGKRNVGMLAGDMTHWDCGGIITNSVFQGKVTGVGSGESSAYYGGISGAITGSIDNVKVYIELNSVKTRPGTDREHYVGGVSGIFSGCNASNLKVYANITTEQRYSGGIFGRISTKGNLSDSIFDGTVTLNSIYADYSGLALGYFSGSSTIPEDVTTFKNNTIRGTLNANGAYSTGGIGRALYAIVIEDNVFDIKIVDAKNAAGGLIGILTTAQKPVIRRNNITVDLTSSSNDIGGLIGRFNNSTSIYGAEVTIEDNTVQGTVRGNQYVGGFIGNNYECYGVRCLNSIVRRNLSATNVIATGDYSGGFFGRSYTFDTNLVYSENAATGNVTSEGTCVGGFGGISASTIIDSRASGIVTAGDRGGSFIGCSYSHATEYYSVIKRSYATGQVIESGGSAYGGFIGYEYENASWIAKEYEASFWDVNSTGQSTSAGDMSKIFALPTASAQVDSTYIAAGWIFTPLSGTWKLPFAGSSYPLLQWE